MSEVVSYWDVCVLKAGNSKETIFTYEFGGRLERGQLVKISFKQTTSLGIVIAEASKPTFATKHVSEVFNVILPPHLNKIANWMSKHYVTPLGRVYSTILPSNLNVKPKKKFSQKKTTISRSKITLQNQQKIAVKKILEGVHTNYPCDV